MKNQLKTPISFTHGKFEPGLKKYILNQLDEVPGDVVGVTIGNMPEIVEDINGDPLVKPVQLLEIDGVLVFIQAHMKFYRPDTVCPVSKHRLVKKYLSEGMEKKEAKKKATKLLQLEMIKGWIMNENQLINKE